LLKIENQLGPHCSVLVPCSLYSFIHTQMNVSPKDWKLCVLLAMKRFSCTAYKLRNHLTLQNVIVIVIKHLYSATFIRGAPGPVSSLTNREVFRCLRNWSDDYCKKISKRL